MLNQEKQTKKKSLKTLRNFNQKLIIRDWWEYRVLSLVLKRINLKIDCRYGIKLLKMASDVIEHKYDENYFSNSLYIYAKSYIH